MRTSRIALVVIVALAALSAGATATRADPAAPGTRAMWVWTADPPAEIVGWATDHQVSEIFAAVPLDVGTSPDLGRLQDLSQRADAADIRLTALGGDPGWVTDQATALSWLQGVAGTGLFAGIHVDVEPYLLPTWTTDPGGTASDYLDLLTLLANVGAAYSLPLEVDVPFWFGMITIPTGNLATAVLDRVAAATVMTFRDTATGPNSLTDVATDALNRGAAASKPIRLAAETQPLPDCPHCTFSEEGAAAMTTVLTTVDTIGQGFSAYAGIAIHHYHSWTLLAP